MAARYENIGGSLTLSWTVKIDFTNSASGTISSTSAPLNLIGASSISGSGFIRNYDDFCTGFETYYSWGSPYEHDTYDDGPAGQTANGSRWYGLYYPYTIYITVGDGGTTNTDSHIYFIWVKDIWASVPGGPLGCGPRSEDIVYQELEVTFEAETSGYFIKGYRDDDMVPTRRQLLDFTDQSGILSWYTDADTETTIRAIHPTGTLSVTGNPWTTETEIGLNPFSISPRINHNYFSVYNTPLGWISDLEFGTFSTDLSNLDLYSPGTDIPDPTNEPTWGRTDTYTTQKRNKVYNDSGITMTQINGTAGSVDNEWIGTIVSPQWGYINSKAYKWSDSESEGETYSGVVFESDQIVEWDETTHISSTDPWTGDSKYFYKQGKSWEWAWEQGNYTGSPISVRVQKEWRDDNDENVGEDDLNEEDELETLEDLNDQTMIIRMYPLNATDFANEDYLWPMISLEFPDPIDLLIPYGETIPPSLWIGNNVTVGSAPNYNNFTVANGASNCYVTRDLLSRFELRMERLNDHINDPTAEHLYAWIWLNKANVSQSDAQDDPDWHSDLTGGVDAEDIRDLSNRQYLLLDIDAPVSGELTLQLDYHTWSFSTMNYTCFGHQFGEDGTFEAIDNGERYLSWTFDVVEGNNIIQLDIQCSDTLEDVIHENSIKHASQWTINLPDNTTGLDELWVLNSFELVFDTENTSTTSYRYKRPHSWLNKNWFGFDLFFDGIPSYIDYGYIRGTEQEEKAYLQSQTREHCPDSALTDLLDYAKTLDTLVGELNWQEGIDADFNDCDESEYNMDADDNKLAPYLYWWDLDAQDERSDGDTQGAIGVKQIYIPGALEFWVNTDIYIQGKVTGIIRNETAKERVRNETGIIDGYYRDKDSEDLWTIMGYYDTDSQGRFKTDPIKELPYEYRIGEDGDVLTVINRSYTFASAYAANMYYDPHIMDDKAGNLWMAVESDNVIYTKVKGVSANDSWANTPARPFSFWEGQINLNRPSICSLNDGRILVSANDGTDTYISQSYDCGKTWELLDSDAGDGIIDGTLWYDNLSQVYLSGTDGNYIVIRFLDITDLENYTLSKNVTLGEGRTFVYTTSDGRIWVGYDQLSDIIYYHCSNIDDNFVNVTTSEIGEDIIYGVGHFLEGEHGIVGAKDNGDDSNNIVFRNSTQQTLEDDISEVVIDNVLWTTDTAPKSCINMHTCVVVIGAGGRLTTWRFVNQNDGFEQIA